MDSSTCLAAESSKQLCTEMAGKDVMNLSNLCKQHVWLLLAAKSWNSLAGKLAGMMYKLTSMYNT